MVLRLARLLVLPLVQAVLALVWLLGLWPSPWASSGWIFGSVQFSNELVDPFLGDLQRYWWNWQLPSVLAKPGFTGNGRPKTTTPTVSLESWCTRWQHGIWWQKPDASGQKLRSLVSSLGHLGQGILEFHSPGIRPTGPTGTQQTVMRWPLREHECLEMQTGGDLVPGQVQHKLVIR